MSTKNHEEHEGFLKPLCPLWFFVFFVSQV